MNRTNPLNSSTDIRIAVYLIDDNALSREGLRNFLEGEPGIEVKGHAALGPKTVEQMALAPPDVVILAPHHHVEAAKDVIRDILKLGPPVQLMVISERMVFEELCRLLQAGVKGCVLYDSVDSEIIRAIRAVHAGKRYLSSAVSHALVDDYIKKGVLSVHAKDPLLSLNMREKEVLQLVVEGKGSGTIADILNLSVSTVNTYRSRVMKKLGLRDLPGLVRFAIQNKITPSHPDLRRPT
ncbi:MAG TPA: response regulator transcription factor [Syntrophorhabdaceae bacterium]|jgi:DNA-binding NarL/FixJ family response regulator